MVVERLRTLFRLIRFPNLIIVGLTQALLYYLVILPFLQSHGIDSTLGPLNFSLLVLTTMLIAAGGYVVNDLYDQAIDAINKPDRLIIGKSLSESKAWSFYGLLCIIGAGLAIYLGWVEQKLALLPIYPLAVLLLWLYAAYLKRLPLWGNLVVAIFCAFVAGIVWLGELEAWQSLRLQDELAGNQLGGLLLAYLWFAFASTLFREMIKDLEDQEGDAAQGCRTLPIVVGTARAKVFTLLIGVLLWFSLVAWAFAYHDAQFSLGMFYLILGIVLPLLLMIYWLSYARTTKEFHRLSQWAKYLMLSGLIYFVRIGLEL